MIIKRYIFIVSFLVLSLAAAAQAPGYPVKRFAVLYSNYFGPAAKGPTAAGHQGPLIFNSRHSLAIDYIVSRYTSLVLSCDIYNTGAYYKQAINVSPSLYSPSWLITAKYYPDPMLHRISAMDISFDYKVFFKALAPYGKYLKLGLKNIHGKVSFNASDFDYTNEHGEIYSPDLGTGKFNTFTLDFGWGKQQIWFRKMIVDAGVDMCFSGSMFTAVLGEYQTTKQTDYIANEAINRTLRMHLLNMHIGIGYLAR